MKTNFAKKIVKISTIAVFSVFVFTLFNFETVYAKAAYSVEETTYDVGGNEIKRTVTVYEDENGREITRVEKVPTDTKSGYGTVREFYTDSTGEYTRKGDIGESGDYSWDEESWYVADEFSGSATEYNTVSSTNGKKFIYTLLQPLPQEGEDLQENVTLKEYLTWAFRFTLALAGFLAVMMIVIGGVEWIISGANEASRSDAKKRINNAISGLVLALVSYLVLYTINPSLVDFNNNCFFKDCDKETTTNSGNNTNNSNGNTGDGINVVFPDNEGIGGTIKDSTQDTYQKQDGDYSYNVKRTKETVEYQNGTVKYRTLERYTDKDKDNHYVVAVKDAQGNDIFSGESVEYFDNDGNYEEIKFFKDGKEVELSDFNYE